MHATFAADGWLSESPDFEYRAEQQRMDVEAGQELEKKRVVLIEAGTGVGKSLTYLIPVALLAVRGVAELFTTAEHDELRALWKVAYPQSSRTMAALRLMCSGR